MSYFRHLAVKTISIFHWLPCLWGNPYTLLFKISLSVPEETLQFCCQLDGFNCRSIQLLDCHFLSAQSEILLWKWMRLRMERPWKGSGQSGYIEWFNYYSSVMWWWGTSHTQTAANAPSKLSPLYSWSAALEIIFTGDFHMVWVNDEVSVLAVSSQSDCFIIIKKCFLATF